MDPGSGCTRDVVEVMKAICDLVEKEGFADGHPTLKKLLQQKLVQLNL